MGPVPRCLYREVPYIGGFLYRDFTVVCNAKLFTEAFHSVVPTLEISYEDTLFRPFSCLPFPAYKDCNTKALEAFLQNTGYSLVF